MAALLPLLMPVIGVSPGGVTIPFLVVALIDIWAHRCLVSFCSSTTGDLFHCLAECVAFNDLRMEWCRRCSVPPATAAFWVRHPWLFNPESLCNTPTLVHAHVAFVGQACERSLSLSSLSLSLSL